MPNLFRTPDGHAWKASDEIPLTLADGTKVSGIWAGSAMEEKLDWWLRPFGNQLTQSEVISEIAVKADDTKEMIWGAAPPEARLFFVLEAMAPGKNYRLAKMVTTAATPAQVAYFRHERFSLFGKLGPDGSPGKIAPLPPPPPLPKTQGELF